MSDFITPQAQRANYDDPIDYSLPKSVLLDLAVEHIRRNPGETPAATGRLYRVAGGSIEKRLKREPTRHLKQHGGHNKILQDHQEEAIHTLLSSLLAHGLMPTTELIYGIICQMVKELDPTRKPPSEKWFRGWWKSKKLHMITTKPIETVRVTAADVEEIRRWHRNYVKFLERPLLVEGTETSPPIYGPKIKMKRVYNFDEGGFRAGCMRGQKIIVPLEVKQYYNLSSEDRRPSTIIEAVNAVGGYPIPPYIIVQGKEKKREWFHPNLPKGTKINTTESSVTNKEVGVDWMKHFIQHTGAGPDKPWIVLLMDQHSSHMSVEFNKLANANNIRPYPFPSHLTHCMQPLDVGLFHPYKHWHQKALRRAMQELKYKYSVVDFLGDLAEIRRETFTKSNIKSAWKKSGMNPPAVNETLKHVKIFSNDDFMINETLRSRDNDEPSLPQLPRTPTKPSHVERGMAEWDSYLENLCSSGHREEYKRFSYGVKRTAAEAGLTQTELKLVTERRKEELENKTKRRKVIRMVGIEGVGFTGADVERWEAIEVGKAKAAQESKEWNAHKKLWLRMEKEPAEKAGKAARKQERERVTAINKLKREKKPIPPELEVPIPDPWQDFIRTNPTYPKYRAYLDEQALKRAEKKGHARPTEGRVAYNDDEEPSFILDSSRQEPSTPTTRRQLHMEDSEFLNQDRIPLGPYAARQAFDDPSSDDDDDSSEGDSSDDDEDNEHILGLK